MISSNTELFEKIFLMGKTDVERNYKYISRYF